MTERDALEKSHGRLPMPKLNCPKCRGSGAVYDPPFEEQKREQDAGTRRWFRRVSCDCYGEEK